MQTWITDVQRVISRKRFRERKETYFAAAAGILDLACLALAWAFEKG